MKRTFAAFLLLCASAAAFAEDMTFDEAAFADDPYASGFDPWYAGASGTLVLPQNGSRLPTLGGATLRAGYYFTEDWALEGDASWTNDRAGLGAHALWHLHGWQEFNLLFGYERFDPFLTFGARGWLPDGQVGPDLGFGGLYYLTDRWALRGDATATLGLDSSVGMVYTLGLGVQYTF